MIQHRIDARNAGHTDGARWKPRVSVGVVGRIYLEVFVEDTPNGEVLQCVDDGGVALQRHSLPYSVHVECRNVGLLAVVGGFAVHDGCQRDDFLFRHLLASILAHFLQLGKSALIPEGGIFFLQSLEESVDAHVPIHLIRVGHKQSWQRLLRVAQ